MPGKPRPAERNDPARLELVIEATPWIAVREGTVSGVGLPTGTLEGSTPAWRLWVEGFCGLAGVGVVCAMLGIAWVAIQSRTMASTCGIRFTKALWLSNAPFIGVKT